MADAPNDYRDPKVTGTTEKKSSLAGIIAWTLLALGIIALLLWLLGLLGNDEEEVVVTPAPTTQEETIVTTPVPDTPTTVTPAPTDDTVVVPAPAD